MTIEQACEFVGVGRTPSGFMTAGGVRDGASYIRPEAWVGDLFDHSETDERVAVAWDGVSCHRTLVPWMPQNTTVTKLAVYGTGVVPLGDPPGEGTRDALTPRCR